ncbi:MAG TPA: HD domain-containing phosphohydrolase [Gemmataceae bacterium]|nr:HD domain-containing phosphohydrolase [Gemmataceae bacterium]
MSDSRILLGKIRELRVRLTQMQGIVGEANLAAVHLAYDEKDATVPAPEEGARRQALLEASLKQLAGDPEPKDIRPTQLIGRVRHLLERGRDIVGKLKGLADEPLLHRGDIDSAQWSNDPLLDNFRETAAMTESAFRLVQVFPDNPSAQLRLSDGLESIIQAITDRVTMLSDGVGLRRSELDRRDLLAEFLMRLKDGNSPSKDAFMSLAESILTEAHHGTPMRFLHAPVSHPAAFVACHSITVARIAERMLRHDPDWLQHALDVVAAALLKDVGMLKVSPEILGETDSLSEEQKHQVEMHAKAGAELVAKYLPDMAGLYESIIGHHERLDGTGYPNRLQEKQISALPRLLAIADIYSALCSPRPHRPARDPRTALTETLGLAERGQLDRNIAQKLLQLSFYPVGSVVEMADGSIGMVVATHTAPKEKQSPAKPVLAILVDHAGHLLPAPKHLDLVESEKKSIIRTLSQAQRRDLLGKRYPELI